MAPVLEIRGVCKKFRINQNRLPYLSLRDSITAFFRFPRQKNNNSKLEDFWALKDITFDVQWGDSFGIIGQNGAGKSTLLKILSKITPPTKGKIISRGRIASLLEVGTGFHPELTGRENIFLNGSILGMKRQEIHLKFDEIVDFSGVEKFLETPLKHYSSGMQLRLAFAVAAFLEPEVLVIDEVLAVGDSVFQQKCVNKMSEVSRSGRTILFVSHNMGLIDSLCNKGVLLDKGSVVYEGKVPDVISKYSSKLISNAKEYDLSNLRRTTGKRELLFGKVIFDKNPVCFGETIQMVVYLKSKHQPDHKNIDIAVNIMNGHNQCLIHCCNRFIGQLFDHGNDLTGYLFKIENILKPGMYYFDAFLRTNDGIQDWLQNIASIEILEGNPYGYTDSKQIQGDIFPGYIISRK